MHARPRVALTPRRGQGVEFSELSAGEARDVSEFILEEGNAVSALSARRRRT